MISFLNSVLQHLRETKRQQVKIVQIWDYSKISADCFAKHLIEVDWDRMIANRPYCPDTLFSTFYNNHNKIVNKHAPRGAFLERRGNLSGPNSNSWDRSACCEQLLF